ncbi:MAG: hypothetical protein HFJ65_05005 [Eggerthellaceae bacterium]|nr:hypothetical protein [Eggerthellaceae bacterium]
MKKSSLGKRAVAGACALTLALSMPVLAFGTGDQEPVTDAQELAQKVADNANVETTFDDTTNKATTTLEGVDSGLAVQPSDDANVETSNDASVSVEYVVDSAITDQDALDEAIAGADAPILQEVTTPSAAFDEAKNGGDDLQVAGGITKDEAKELISSEDNYISASTFEVNPVSEAATGATVTVVYTTDEHAENVECYAYVTYKDGNGATVNKVEKLTGTNGVYSLSLGQVAEAEVTFVLKNSLIAVQPAPATTHVDNGGNDTDGYDLAYTTGATKTLMGNGGLNWSASASADVHQTTSAPTAAYLSISANDTVGSASPAFTAAQHNNPLDFQKVINVTVSSTAPADDITNAAINANVGAANRSVRVFWDETDADGKVVGKYRDVTSDADGNITVPGIVPGTIYTLAVSPAGVTPPTPDNPDIPVIPDQPVNPDNPNIPIIPGGDEPGNNGSDEGEAAGNGAAATDNGATSPKTGIFA